MVIAFDAFASFQGYAIVKRYTKTTQKEVLQKLVLIYNKNKEYIDTAACFYML